MSTVTVILLIGVAALIGFAWWKIQKTLKKLEEAEDKIRSLESRQIELIEKIGKRLNIKEEEKYADS